MDGPKYLIERAFKHGLRGGAFGLLGVMVTNYLLDAHYDLGNTVAIVSGLDFCQFASRMLGIAFVNYRD